MGALRWVYRRLGQITCFTLGGLFIFVTLISTYDKLVPAIIAAILLGVALALRHQMMHRPQPPADTLSVWWATLTPQQQNTINELLTPKN